MNITLSWDKVAPQIIVGSYPDSPESISFLKDELGVTAVLNLQSDKDLYRRGIRWELLWRAYVGQSMEVVRVPIIDLKPTDLEKNMSEAVDALTALASRHEKIYVHCNVGINRSPTAVIAYLVSTGMSLAEAEQQVRSSRECVPYVDVVERWMVTRGY